MKEFQEIDRLLLLDGELDTNLELLVYNSVEEKTLVFTETSNKIDFEKLIDANILKEVNGKLEIEDSTVFGYKLYTLYKGMFRSELNDNFHSYIKLISEIEEAYKTTNVVRGLTSFLYVIWSIAILDFNIKFNCNFTQFIETLNEKDSDIMFSFNEGYSISLPFMIIDIPAFYQNQVHLIELTKSDADYNFPLGSTLKGIYNKIVIDSKWGIECFEYAIKQTPTESNFLIPVISGLYDTLGFKFYKDYLYDKITDENLSLSIICGLSSIKLVSKTESSMLLDIYLAANRNNTEILLNLPRLLFAIINSKSLRKNSVDYKKSFEYLEELLDIENHSLISHILRNIVYLETHIKHSQNLIFALIEKAYFKVEYLSSINTYLWKIKDINFFEQVLYKIAEHHAFMSISRNLTSTINEFQTNQKTNFDKVIVKLLVQDSAANRFIGLDIFNSLSRDSYTLAYNILDLTPLRQYKLWVTLLQTYREPKYVLPSLMPLIQSKSELVRESFICKLEEYSESYGSLVTKQVETHLDLTIKENQEVLDRITRYKEEFYNNNIFAKEGIKELNPFFTQNKLFIDFNNNRNRAFSKQAQKISEDKSFIMNLFPKVALLKGGGWKMDGREEISKLGKFSSSFSLPRLYFIQPEHFDFNSTLNIGSDWDDTSFAEITKVLENEQQ